MTQKPSSHEPKPIGSSTPSRRRNDAARQGDAPTQAWRDTEDDPSAPVVQARQSLDPLADFVIGSLSLIGVLMLLAWLWWAGNGGKWVMPW